MGSEDQSRVMQHPDRRTRTNCEGTSSGTVLFALQPIAGRAAANPGDRCSALNSFHIAGGRIISARHIAASFEVPPSMSSEAIAQVREKLSRPRVRGNGKR